MVLLKVWQGLYFYICIFWPKSITSPFMSSKLGVPTPLEHPSNIITCQKGPKLPTKPWVLRDLRNNSDVNAYLRNCRGEAFHRRALRTSTSSKNRLCNNLEVLRRSWKWMSQPEWWTNCVPISWTCQKLQVLHKMPRRTASSPLLGEVPLCLIMPWLPNAIEVHRLEMELPALPSFLSHVKQKIRQF